jgi:hypothetical protein
MPLGDDDDFWADSAALQKAYEAGKKRALLNQLNRSFVLDRPVPGWARSAFKAAYKKKLDLEIRSWDEVFGKPIKKHARPAITQIADVVYNAVAARHAAGESIGKEMFASIGKEVGASGAKVERLYNDFRRWISEERQVEAANPEDCEVTTITVESISEYPEITPHRGKRVVRKNFKNK